MEMDDKLKVHKPISWIPKKFDVITYKNGIPLNHNPIDINTIEEFKTSLEELKQFNNDKSNKKDKKSKKMILLEKPKVKPGTINQ